MSPASSDASMLAVAVPAPLRPTLLAVHSCNRQHANLLVPAQIVSGASVGTVCVVYVYDSLFLFEPTN
jgi:malonyl CoA-acyl carrier protein transacylase